jgi:hypothetical protein
MGLVQIIVASIGLFASVITASISYYFTKKHQLKIQDRRLKEEFYKSFIKSLSDVAKNNKDSQALDRLSEGFNSLLLIGSPDVVEKLMDYHDFIKMGNNTIPRDSNEWRLKHDEMLKKLIITIRKDLFGNEKNADEKLKKVHLVGKG